ncbi:hypothetical protein T265_15366, partial [Opisthorchis viverrini]
YQLIATVVDPKGSEFPLDDKYDVNSGADHLLMEARLCNFMWKAFKRSKILHKLQFGCDMHGRQKENAVLGLHFRKDELAYFGVPANNSVLGEEIVRVTSPIPQMFGLKEVSFPHRILMNSRPCAVRLSSSINLTASRHEKKQCLLDTVHKGGRNASEIKYEISVVKQETAPEPHNLHPALFKESGQPTVAHPVSILATRFGTPIATPLFKKGTQTAYENYCGICLPALASKVLYGSILRKFTQQSRRPIREYRAEFSPATRRTNHIFTLREIIESRH